jgi:hypothetical protein
MIYQLIISLLFFIVLGGNLIEKIKYQVRTIMSSEAQNTKSTFAVDGQLGPDPDKCHCCSITNNSPLSWWLLDLGKRYPLKSIVIYGRNKGDFITVDIQFVICI